MELCTYKCLKVIGIQTIVTIGMNIYIQEEKTSNILTIDNSVYGVLNSRYVVLDEY